MVGETVTPYRNTHFNFNDYPGSPRGIEVACKYNKVLMIILQDWMEILPERILEPDNWKTNRDSFLYP
jgi:hypothetical protein